MKNWTEEEEKFLIEHWNKISTDKFIEIFKRTKNAIYIKANQLKLRKYNDWTDEEIELLLKFYENSKTEELKSLFINHTLGSLNKKAVVLGLKRNNIKKPKWTNEEIEKLKFLVLNKVNDGEISKILNKTEISVKINRRNFCREYFIWSEYEISILTDYYKNKTINELLFLIPNKTKDQIQKKANILKIYKPDSLLWSNDEVELLKIVYKDKTIEELSLIFKSKTKKQIKRKAQLLKLRKTEETLAKCFKTEIGKVPLVPGKLSIWRHKILKRDDFCCKICGLKDKTGLKLQIHHIIPVRDKKCELYNIKNGICLCINCHINTYNREYEFIEKFDSLLEEPK